MISPEITINAHRVFTLVFILPKEDQARLSVSGSVGCQKAESSSVVAGKSFRRKKANLSILLQRSTKTSSSLLCNPY
jgi:hypothetical protein